MTNREKLESVLTDIIPGIDLTNTRMADEGLIDSFDMVALVGELMDAFDVTISIDDILPENFNSVDGILALVEGVK